MDNLLDLALEISDKEEKRIAKKLRAKHEVLLVRLSKNGFEWIIPENMSRIRFNKIKDANIELIKDFKLGTNMHLSI